MRVLIPLPDRDFDVTEVAVPWRLLTEAGHDAVFATERGGNAPVADPRLIGGVIFGELGAYEEPRPPHQPARNGHRPHTRVRRAGRPLPLSALAR